MSSFNANSQAYNIATENELSEVLSHYNSEFVFSIIDNALKKRFVEVPIASIPNVVGAWEQNFKAIISQYGDDSIAEVYRVRNETYMEIIDTICKEFGLNFTIDDTVDVYSAAYHLYDFFVCNFANNLITFFANTIYKERAAYYDMLGLAEMKKNKDSSTIYGKKVYKDVKLAVIMANIDMVVSAVCQTVKEMDIKFYSILGTICGENSEFRKYLISIISADSDFFEKNYEPIINSDIRSEIITGIRFKMHEIMIAHDQISSSAEIGIASEE